MNFVPHFNFYGIDAKQIPCITGAGAPTTETKGAVGCFYFDTNDGTVYKCTAANNNVYTWVNIGVQGNDGVGIANIEQTNSVGNGKIDIYTITLTNGDTYTFYVTNGTDGDDYVLTEADKEEIAAKVLTLVEDGNGVAY